MRRVRAAIGREIGIDPFLFERQVSRQFIDGMKILRLTRWDALDADATAAWKGSAFDDVRDRSDIDVQILDSASHSFADADSRVWLCGRIEGALQAEFGA